MRRKTTTHKSIKPVAAALIKGDNKNHGKWNMGIVIKLFRGNDGEIRAVKLRAGKDKLERAIQHIFPLELSCNINRQIDAQLNVNAKEFRPKRNAASVADLRMRNQTEIEQEEPYIE